MIATPALGAAAPAVGRAAAITVERVAKWFPTADGNPLHALENHLFRWRKEAEAT